MTPSAAFFSKERIVAPATRWRWWIAPSALAIHMSIGQAYAFSVFNLPLTKAIGVDKSAPLDWKLTELGWIFTVAIAFLGISAAVFGEWLEKNGPRAGGLASAICFGSGLLVAALGVKLHALWILVGGYGVLGGIGLGLGYITPVSTLIRWFPDRCGMATGIAIMGFGGGAIVAAPLSTFLMKRFATPSSVGVAETFVVLGVLYFLVMSIGALSFRLPPEGWTPAGWAPKKEETGAWMHTREAVRTPQFWLLWVVLCVNVTAGIGVLGQASAMIQEVFKGEVGPDGAARFVSALSASNMIGRFFWASLSDRIGRRATYACFFSIGPVLYLLAPVLGGESVLGFVLCFCAILTMYGGGFATIPAYIADLFGARFVSAIHGRLLTAWSVAGVLGPTLINYMRQAQIDQGVPKAQAYNLTMRLMAALLLAGFVANFLVRPVDPARMHARGS